MASTSAYDTWLMARIRPLSPGTFLMFSWPRHSCPISPLITGGRTIVVSRRQAGE